MKHLTTEKKVELTNVMCAVGGVKKIHLLEIQIYLEQQKKEQAKEQTMHTYKELIDNDDAYDEFMVAHTTLLKKHVIRGTRVLIRIPDSNDTIGIYLGLTFIDGKLFAVCRMFQEFIVTVHWVDILDTV